MSANLQASKARVVEIASKMISGSIRPLLGARLLYSELLVLEKETDPLILRFIIGVYSESDTFPLGDERERWAPEALRERDERSARYEARVRVQ